MTPGGAWLREIGRSLLLLKLRNRNLDIFLTVALAAVLCWTRFGLLANGPWEWDETLFARGILSFELAAHFPHPPGFPGWLAIGHLLLPVTGDPLLALQLASAGFSVAALWLLAALGRRVAHPATAVAAALVVLFAPGPWLFSVRGFSSTAAAVLGLAAAAYALAGLAGRRVTVFSLLIAAALLVRPHFAPALGILWLGSVIAVKPRRRLVPGIAIGAAVTLLAVAMMVRAEGGVSAFFDPFAVHFERHFSRLATSGGSWNELGLTAGLGGNGPAAVIALLVVIGLGVWWRRVGGRAAILWLVVLSIATVQLLWLQNRASSRYAVGVQMAAAPLMAGAVAWLPPVVGCSVLFGFAGWLGFGSLPLLQEQHLHELPGWRAVQDARLEALSRGGTVVLEPELYPFASYLWHLNQRRGADNPEWVLSPWAPEEWQGVDGHWTVATVHRHLYPRSVFGIEERIGGVSDSLVPLTQRRFLEAWVITDPPLPISGWWPAERTPDGRPFMWGGVETEMILPSLSPGSVLGIDFRPAPGKETVEISFDRGDPILIGADGGRRRLRFVVRSDGNEHVLPLSIRRERGRIAGGGDSRVLGLQLFDIMAVDSKHGWSVTADRFEFLGLIDGSIEGAYAIESFGRHGDGAWLAPKSVLRVPAGAGTLDLKMSGPRPTPPRTEIWVGGRRLAGPLDITTSPSHFIVEIKALDDDREVTEIQIVSQPYQPAADLSVDPRMLGVVLSSISFEPSVGGM